MQPIRIYFIGSVSFCESFNEASIINVFVLVSVPSNVTSFTFSPFTVIQFKLLLVYFGTFSFDRPASRVRLSDDTDATSQLLGSAFLLLALLFPNRLIAHDTQPEPTTGGI